MSSKTRSTVSKLVPADLVVIRGRVITVDRSFSIKQAVAVKDGKIVAVGTNEEVKPFISKETVVLDLEGKSILPGINDSHIHAALFGGTRPPLTLDIGYSAVGSIAEIVEMLNAKVKIVPPGEWIRGVGWDEGCLEECLEDPARHPTRWDLDAVSPDNPVCFIDHSVHVVWVNSKALELAGITKNTPDPYGGKIQRDPVTGEPTGILKELPAQGMVMRVVPPLSRQQKRQAILSAMKELNSQGITSITEGALGPGGARYQGGLLDAECIDIYKDLYNEGNLTVRINVMLLFGDYGACSFKDLQQGLDIIGVYGSSNNEWLKIAGVKIFADGVPGSKTAWMYEEYVGGGNGQLCLPGETEEERFNELTNMIIFSHKHGFRLGIHAVGDRAVDACVGGFIKAMRQEPSDLRHYIIHGDFISEKSTDLMAKYHIGANVQPSLKAAVSHRVDQIVGYRRSARQWPLRTVIDAGVHMAASSDAPVTYPNWREGVQAAVLRESRTTGRVSGAEQCISREEAIRAYTIEGAWQDCMENLKGSIEVGKLADFCVLYGDILTINPHQIKNIPILMTIVSGEIVYDTR